MNKFILLLFFNCLIATNIYPDQPEQYCENVFNKYGIDMNIKKPKGWLRAYNNNKLQLYTKLPLSVKDKHLLKECIDKEVTSVSYRSFENTDLEDPR
jgi:hypothetical protein